MPMYQTTTGIVLHALKYSDTANIIDIYTESSGRLSFLVPLSRGKKSKIKYALFQPLSIIELEISLRPTANLHRIKEAKLMHPFSSIPYNPYKSAIALFLAEFLCRGVREEGENRPLFAYLRHSIAWLDACEKEFANFHLVFLMRLSRFLGLYPNVDDYQEGDCFDMMNACFISVRPQLHNFFIENKEAYWVTRLTRMNYETMHLFAMSRVDRARCLEIINDYYRLHIPGFPELKSLSVLRELFD